MIREILTQFQIYYIAKNSAKMPVNRYKELPLEALYNLIVETVGTLLKAAENTDTQEFKAILKDLHLIHFVIKERERQNS